MQVATRHFIRHTNESANPNVIASWTARPGEARRETRPRRMSPCNATRHARTGDVRRASRHNTVHTRRRPARPLYAIEAATRLANAAVDEAAAQIERARGRGGRRGDCATPGRARCHDAARPPPARLTARLTTRGRRRAAGAARPCGRGGDGVRPWREPSRALPRRLARRHRWRPRRRHL
jgi:hypothetical protein